MDGIYEKLEGIYRDYFLAHTEAEAPADKKGICYIKPDPQVIDIILMRISEVYTESEAAHAGRRDDLLLWVKAREVMWRAKLALSSRAAESAGYSSKAEAYHSLWQEMLFPGRSLGDGTLSHDTLIKAEREWEDRVRGKPYKGASLVEIAKMRQDEAEEQLTKTRGIRCNTNKRN